MILKNEMEKLQSERSGKSLLSTNSIFAKYVPQGETITGVPMSSYNLPLTKSVTSSITGSVLSKYQPQNTTRFTGATVTADLGQEVGGVGRALGYSALKGVTEYVQSFSDWVLSLAQQGKKGLASSVEQITLKSEDPERQAILNTYKSMKSSAKSLPEQQAANRYLADTLGNLDRRTEFKIKSDTEYDAGTPKLTAARKAVEKYTEPKVQKLGMLADVGNESWAVQKIAGDVESLSYSGAARIHVLGFFMNYGVQETQSIKQKIAQLQAQGIEITPEIEDQIRIYASGAALIEAGTEAIFPAGGTTAQLALSSVKGLAKFIVAQGGQEAAEEILSSIGQGILAKFTTDKSASLIGIKEDDALISLEGLAGAAFGGFVMGSVMSGVTGTAGYVNTKTVTNKYKNAKVGDIGTPETIELEVAMKEDGEDPLNYDEIKQEVADRVVEISQNPAIDTTIKTEPKPIAETLSERYVPQATAEPSGTSVEPVAVQSKEVSLPEGANAPATIQTEVAEEAPIKSTSKTARVKAINKFADKLVSDGLVLQENIDSVKPIIEQRLANYEKAFPKETLAGNLVLVRGLFTADKTNKEYSDKVFASGKATWANSEIFIKRMGKEAFIKKYPELAYMASGTVAQPPAEIAAEVSEKKTKSVQEKRFADEVSKAENSFDDVLAKASEAQPDKAQQLNFLPDWARPVGGVQKPNGALLAYNGVLDESVDKNIRDSQNIPTSGSAFTDRFNSIKDTVVKSLFRGAWGDLEWAQGEVRRMLRILKERYRITAEVVGNEVKAIYNPLGKELKFAMDMYMLLPDIIEDIETGKYSDDNLPFGFTSIQQVYLEYERIRTAANDPENTTVKKAKERLEDLHTAKVDKFMGMAKEIGFDPSRLFLRKQYLHHEIIEYMEKAKTDTYYKNKMSGIFKARDGSVKPYVTDSAIAYFLAFRKMEEDMAKMELMIELKKQDAKGKWGKDKNGRYIAGDGYSLLWSTDFGFTFPENLLKQNAVQNVKDFAKANNLTDDDPAVLKMMQKALKTEQNMYFIVPSNVAIAIKKAFLPAQDANALSKLYLGAKQGWQQWMLKAPHLALKYQTKNAIGDINKLFESLPGALKLQYTKKATAELWQYMYGNKEVTARLLKYIREGGLLSGLSDITLEDFRKIEAFDFYDKKGNLKPMEAIRYAFGKGTGAIDKFYTFREQILRFAGFNYLIDHVLNNKRALPADGFYFRSNPVEIKSIRTVEGRAYKIIDDIMGAYDDVSPAGQAFSKWVYSFWRYQETLVKGYFQELINVWYKDPDIIVQVGRSYADKFKATTTLGASALWKLGKLVIKYSAIPLAMFAWNRMVVPDEDDDVPEWARDNPHITLGKFFGKTWYISDTSSLFNALRWIGFDDIYYNLEELITGDFKLGKEMLENVQAPSDEMLNGMLPMFQWVLELKKGEDFYTGGKIYDWWGHVFDNFQMGGVYRTLLNKPVKNEVLFGMTPIKSAMKNESDYWEIYELRDDYLKSIDEYRDMQFGKNKKDLALYNFRTSIRFNDNDSALKYLKQYMGLSSAKDNTQLVNNIEASARAMNPLQSLGKDNIDKFKATLTGKDLQTLEQGMEFYEQFSKDMVDFANNAISKGELK